MASVNSTGIEREMFSGWERERKGERGDGEVHDSTRTFPSNTLNTTLCSLTLRRSDVPSQILQMGIVWRKGLGSKLTCVSLELEHLQYVPSPASLQVVQSVKCYSC